MFPYLFDEWAPSPKKWFNEVFYVQSVKFYFAFVISCAVFVLSSRSLPLSEAREGEGVYISQRTRLILTFSCAAIAFITYYVEVFLAAPMGSEDLIWQILLNGFAGYFNFLTVRSEFGLCLYWTVSSYGEYTWCRSTHARFRPRPRNRAIIAAYTSAIFFACLGSMTSALFLRFNWFDPAFQKQVIQVFENEGNPYFKYKLLATHLNQLPIAILDICVIKQTRVRLLARCIPSLRLLLLFCILTTCSYLALVKISFQVNGGSWTYPLKRATFSSLTGELALLVGITTFAFGVCAIFHFLATHC